MPDGKMTGLQALLVAFVISVIFFVVFIGCPWAVKKWKGRKMSKNNPGAVKLSGLTEGK